jgi:hypothetical protein
MQLPKFYAMRKEACTEVQRSKEFKKSRKIPLLLLFILFVNLFITLCWQGGWNFLACEDCEALKRKIRHAKSPLEKKHAEEDLDNHYSLQQIHRDHYRNVA